jgi:glycosyltransferase EpsD
MSGKILFVSNTANFAKFNRPFMRWFREQGWQVDYASAGEEDVPDCDNHHIIAIVRSPFNLKNLKAYRKLKRIVANNYDIIHCHTPMGAFLARIAFRKNQTKIIYTAHGFHFFKGAPLLNWIVYYPIEKYLLRYTDGLITINKEDYNLAKKKFKIQAAVLH